METNQITREIIGAAQRVLFTLKPGLDEKLYERALMLELRRHGLPCDTQQPFDVSYAGVHIGTLIPDLIVGRQVIVETKVVSTFTESHLAQMLGYLNITALKTGLLLNFKQARLGIKRVSN
jgi:GxxExxY protein